MPPGKATALVANPDADPHRSTADRVAVPVVDAYTLVFRGLAGDDRWFVRTEGYLGVCAALAWEKPLVIPAGTTIRRHLRVLVADGVIRPPR